MRKLNSAHVSMLVGQPDVTLDKLHKVPNFYFDKKTTSTQAKDTKADSKKDLVYAVSKLNFTYHLFFETKDEKKREKYNFKYKLYLSSIFLYTQVLNGCQF